MPNRKLIAAASAAALALAAAGGAAAVLTDPRGEAPALATTLPAVPADEHASTIAAMRPPKRSRPVVAVVGQNDGTETTDYLIPYAVLKDSGAADVFALATEDRPLKLRPALTIWPEATTAEFDRRYPEGADYVVVAAITDRDHPDVVAWIRAQAAKGATIVGICAGSVTLSEAGLLAGRSATGHWHDVKALQKANPTMRWVPDRRYVADRGVVTTTGVSASLPVSLALVEAIAGRPRAEALARAYGMSGWDARHDSSAFKMTPRLYGLAIGNKISVWSRETYGIPVRRGVDDLALGFTADAWARTFRSEARAIGETAAPVVTRRGLRVIPDGVRGRDDALTMLPAPIARADEALPVALAGIRARYGERTAAFVALQLEYAWRP